MASNGTGLILVVEVKQLTHLENIEGFKHSNVNEFF
jgi:hypothetical protein